MRMCELSYIKTATNPLRKFWAAFLLQFSHLPGLKTEQNELYTERLEKSPPLLSPFSSPSIPVLPGCPCKAWFLIKYSTRVSCSGLACFRFWFSLVSAILSYNVKNGPNFNFLFLDVCLYCLAIKSRVQAFKRSYWETSFFLFYSLAFLPCFPLAYYASLFCFRI